MRLDWEDLEPFFEITEFGVPVTITKAGGEVVSLSALFDAPGVIAETGPHEYATTEPQLTARAADLEGVQHGDAVEIDGRAWWVAAPPLEDGTGLAVLQLSAEG